MLGGTPILIEPGVTLAARDTVTCTFGGIEKNGIQLNSTLALCVSPTLQQVGFIPFSFKIAKSSQESQFLSSKFIHLINTMIF